MRDEDYQELERKINIEFPRVISTVEAETLLVHISNSREYAIRYRLGYEKMVRSTIDPQTNNPITMSTSISGTVSTKGLAGYVGFKLDRAIGDDYINFNKMRLDTIPGYTIEEHGQDTIQVWDDLKEKIDQYFSTPRD